MMAVLEALAERVMSSGSEGREGGGMALLKESSTFPADDGCEDLEADGAYEALLEPRAATASGVSGPAVS